MEKNQFVIPGAIIVAGIIIAIAIIYTSQTTTNIRTGEQPTTAQVLTAQVPRKVTGEDHIRGDLNAPIVLIEYSDTECPFCKQFHSTMHKIIGTYPEDVTWVYRHFPIPTLHSKALREAQATECAGELGGNEKFWAYTDRLYEITPSNDGLPDAELGNIAEYVELDRTAFETCIEKGAHEEKIQRDAEEAVATGGRGTPYSVLILKQKISTTAEQTFIGLQKQLPSNTLLLSPDGKRIGLSGAFPFEIMQTIIDSLLGT